MSDETYDDDEIRAILASVKRIAIVGASGNAVRPSYFVLKYLLSKGYEVFPVNPGLAGQEILGRKVYATLAEVPPPVDMVDIFRNSEAADAITDEAIAIGAKVVWMQLGVSNPAAAARARAAGLTVVMNRCPKIEYARLCGEIAWAGVNPGRISSKKPKLMKGFQHLGIVAPGKEE
ncbi:MAG: CoA-binding protein [Rhizobiales bacterium]|nr:CoA-binding protein [Hyphomicrobiales bacterium]